jgi:FMN phosphatase YigB (HAD superfamily)
MTDTLLPHELSAALDRFTGLKVLSLDCFDTLLWRDSHAPQDIFALLPGTTSLQRRWAEGRARKAASVGMDRGDVSIGEIYAQLLPNAAPAERNTAIAAELAAEARHCHAFGPTVALMREAKARGLQVVIVSDTYLDANQLRELIARSAGEDVAGLIDRIFCSSTYGKPKAAGLYGDVLRKLEARPHEILHIGDNLKADVGGVAPFGVQTLHLVQFAEATEERLRHEAAVSALLHAQGDSEATALLPHRAALAIADPLVTDAAENFGLSVLGPVLYGFERWLRDEAEALRQERGGTVHWLFLMRDGHLPRLVHQAVDAGAPGHPIEISRFCAIAASLSNDAAVRGHVELELGLNPETLARQLLVPEADIAAIVDHRSPEEASVALLVEMRREPRRRATIKASRAFARRLVTHVRAMVNPAAGDTLMLVDLGYNGSVQNHVDALLRAELGVHVAGRYLVLREQDRPGLDKRGLIASDYYDAFALEAICANVAVLEQVCTTDSGSTIDYAEDGTPIRRANGIKAMQSETRQRIQAGCVRFAEVQQSATIRRDDADDALLWRKGAAAVLARVMYLPLAGELAVIERFEHDVNLGSGRTVALFDPTVAEKGLRQRGLFYLNGADRMYLPAELKGHGLAPKLSLLAHRRFGLPLGFTDFTDAKITLPVIFADRNEVIQHEAEARATHDGFFVAILPIGDCRYSVALQFGALFEFVQIDSVSAMPLADFVGEDGRANDRQVAIAPAAEGMEPVAGDLFRCDDEAGFLMVHPPERLDDTPMIVAVAFRPIVERTPVPPGSIAEPAMAGASA